jgi:hypothetical protein
MKVLIIILIIVLFTSGAWGWEETKTHPTLAEVAAGYFLNP